MYDLIKIYADTEFNGLNSSSELLSVCLIAETGAYFYMEIDYDNIEYDDFVKTNVLPHMIKNMENGDLRIMKLSDTLTKGLFECFNPGPLKSNFIFDDIKLVDFVEDPNMMNIVGIGSYNEVAIMILLWLYQFTDYSIELILDVGYYDMSKLCDLISAGKNVISLNSDDKLLENIIKNNPIQIEYTVNKKLAPKCLDMIYLQELCKNNTLHISPLCAYTDFNDIIYKFMYPTVNGAYNYGVNQELPFLFDDKFRKNYKTYYNDYININHIDTPDNRFLISRREVFENLYTAWAFGVKSKKLRRSDVLSDYLSIFLPLDIIDHASVHSALVDTLIILAIVLLTQDIGRDGIFYNENNPYHKNHTDRRDKNEII